jgi:hypothetical protein
MKLTTGKRTIILSRRHTDLLLIEFFIVRSQRSIKKENM